jgi:hypothetical protein
MLNRKAMMSFSEERGPSEERPNMWKEELGFEYGAMFKQTRWVGFLSASNASALSLW